ncbi:MAG: T9SS type A sorting domain-containing protein [Tannerellaceae bacterium]|nr:T9SS type A sorting domain-containing protein [Tannerellaceae bacterium]
MKRSFLFLGMLLLCLYGRAENRIVCNFNHLLHTYDNFGNVSLRITSGIDGALGNVGYIQVPANNEGDGVWFQLPSTFNKEEYSHIKLKVKTAGNDSFGFAFKLENTTTGITTQDWESYPSYSGNGNWQEVLLPLNRLATGTYDRIVLVPAPYQNKPTFSFHLDHVTLVSNKVGSNSPVVTIDGNKFYAWGKEIFFNAINTAWQWNSDYRLDFLGRNYDANWWREEFERYEQNRINLARIWIHGGGNSSPSLNGDGMVTGASASFWEDMDNLVALSREKQIYIMPTFWSFDMVKNNYNAVNYQQFRQIINDENKSRWYCEYFLVPFIQRYKDEPYVMGYDICNEPEHMWRDADCGNLSRDNVIRFMPICASYIHRYTNKPVTVGSMWIICNSDRYRGWTDQEAYAGNNYSEQSLRAQYNDPYAYLDFYSPHWYQWQTSGSYFSHTIGEWLDDGFRPALIGETPGYDINTSDWNMSIANCYLNAYWNGYSGVCGWKSPWENDGYGTFSGIAKGTNAFYQNYPSLVYPNGTPMSATANFPETKETSQQTLQLVHSFTYSNNVLEIRLKKQASPVQIEVFTLFGELKRKVSTQEEQLTINLNGLTNNSVLFIQITAGNKSETIKVSTR